MDLKKEIDEQLFIEGWKEGAKVATDIITNTFEECKHHPDFLKINFKKMGEDLLVEINKLK